MDTKERHIDKFYEQKLKHFEDDLPVDLWMALDRKLQKRSIVNIVGWTLIFIMLLILSWYSANALLLNNEEKETNIVENSGTSKHNKDSIANSGFIVMNESKDSSNRKNIGDTDARETPSLITEKNVNKKPSLTEPENLESKPVVINDQVGLSYDMKLTELYRLDVKPVQVINYYNIAENRNCRKVLDSVELTENNSDIKQPWNILLSAGAGMMMTFNKIHSEDTKGEALMKLLNENEDPANSFSCRINIEFKRNNWSLQTGINLLNYREKINYNTNYSKLNESDSYFNVDTTFVWIYNPPNIGIAVPVGFDSSWVNVYDNISMVKKSSNIFRFVEIPVNVKYTFDFRKWGIGLGCGVSYMYLLSAKGFIPDEEGENLLEINRNSEFINKSNMNLSVLINVDYHINDQWFIRFEPQYRQSIFSIYSDNYPVKKLYNSWSFSLSVGYKFK